jgi:hypothetical protein
MTGPTYSPTPIIISTDLEWIFKGIEHEGLAQFPY